MPENPLDSVKPNPQASGALRQRLSLKDEFLLASLPTAMILLVLLLVETLSRQRLLFASLASSAFLIYLDPQHGTNAVKTLALSHLAGALAGAAACAALGEGYLAAAAAMVGTIVFMITFDVVHPPAVSTALAFAFRAENTSGIVLFLLALGVICALVVLQRLLLWLLAWLSPHRPSANGSRHA